MGMWTEWRGPRSEWSRRTKVVAFIAAMAAAMAWVVGVDDDQDRVDAAPAPGHSADG